MKTMRKLLSIILALTMIFTLTATALATDSTDESSEETESKYTITITNDKTGHTYEAYQIFSGTLYEETDEETGETTKILSDIVWGSGVEGSGLLSALKESNTVVGTENEKDITLGSLFANCTTAADVAEVLSENNTNTALAEAFAQVASENLSTTVAGTSTGGTEADNDGKYTYTISGLSAGYYLVKDQDESLASSTGDAYTDIILEVVSNVNVEAKVAYPTVEKKVSGDGENWQDTTDANIGDTVYYQLTATVPDTSAYDKYTFVFHDTLSNGLTFKSNSVKIVVDNTEIPTTQGEDDGKKTNWTLTTATDLTDGCTFEVKFEDILSLVDSDGKAVTVSENSTIVVTYTATLNSNAVIGNAGNKNEVYLEYSNNPNGEGKGKTETDTVVTFTFELDVTKVDGETYDKDEGTYGTALKGAEFVLYYTETATDADGNETSTNYYLTANENRTDSGSYTVTGWTGTESSAMTLVSAEGGTFEIIGLDAGTYYLEETKAPEGYNKLTSPITLVITAEYKDTDDDGVNEVKSLTATAESKSLTASAESGKIEATIENNKGSELPSTGGIGTTIFYVVGGILVVGAIVLLITKKRLGNKDE